MLESSDRARPLQVSTRNLAPLAALSDKIGPGHNDILDALKYATRPDADGVIGLADYCRLLRALSVVAGEETFDLSSRPMMAGTAEIVFSRAAQAATLGEALREIAHGYNVLHGDHYNRVELRGRKLVYIIDDEHFPYTRPRDDFLNLSLECALIFVHGALCELADEDLTYCARRIWTRRAAGGGGAAAALAFWDAPVSYGEPVYAVAYDAAIAARPLSRRPRQVRLDEAAHNRLLSLIEARQAGGSSEDAVTGAVLRALRDGLHDQSAIAARLGVSTATLRRKLTAAGANFRALHQSVLKQAACLRLVETGDVGETAETLGFSDPRSFTRAFKAWTGETPSGFMVRRRAGTG
jgi:AraC-like DNA-binding protein